MSVTTKDFNIVPKDCNNIDLENEDKAIRVVKKQIPLKVEFANEDGECQTKEGVVNYVKGDAILTGTRGERWPIRRAKFEETYYLVDVKKSTYAKKPTPVLALRMNEPFKVNVSWSKDALIGIGGQNPYGFATLESPGLAFIGYVEDEKAATLRIAHFGFNGKDHPLLEGTHEEMMKKAIELSGIPIAIASIAKQYGMKIVVDASCIELTQYIREAEKRIKNENPVMKREIQSVEIQYWNINEKIIKVKEELDSISIDDKKLIHELTSGDWLVQYGKGDLGVVDTGIFRETYAYAKRS